MILQDAWQVCFDFLGAKPVVVEPSACQVSSDAGLLPFRQLHEQLGLTRQFAVPPTTPTPIAAKARTATRNSNAACRPAA